MLQHSGADAFTATVGSPDAEPPGSSLTRHQLNPNPQHHTGTEADPPRQHATRNTHD